MVRNLRKRIVLLSSCLIIISSALFTYVYYHNYQKSVYAELYNIVSDIQDLNYQAYDQFENYRITVLDLTGEVIYDNQSTISEMDNHLNRIEIQESLKDIYGTSKRKSTTVDLDSYYVAIKTESKIIRISKDAKTVVAIFIEIIPYIIGICLALIGLVYYLSKFFIKQLQHSFKNKHLAYAELQPIVAKMDKQKQKINRNALSIMKYKNNLNYILEAVEEGVFIIDQNKNIKIYNRNLLSLLAAKNIDYHNKELLFLCRHKEFNQVIENLKEDDAELEFEYNDRPLQLQVKFFVIDDETKGYIGIVQDMTTIYESIKSRQEFTSNVTHELKTPLTSIMGYADLLSMQMVKQEDIVNFATKISIESKRLLALIDDILRLSSLDETHHVDLETVNVDDCISKAINNLSIQLNSADEIIYQPAKALVLANDKLLYTVIENIISNSIKYKKEQLKLQIKVQEINETWQIEIIDQGIGIPQADIPYIFERFYRVDKARRGNSTGLGLAICKHIINLFKGTIFVESELGKYTKFTITLNKPNH